MTSKTPPGRSISVNPTPTPGELVTPVYVGRLETVKDWRRQISKIYREMRRRELAPEDGTKLAFVANLGAQLAKVEQELKEVQALREQLARIEAVDQNRAGLTQLLPAFATSGEVQQ